MHGQPFLGDCVRHSRCQPFESLELDANGWCRVLSLLVLSCMSECSVLIEYFLTSIGHPLGMMKTWGKLVISLLMSWHCAYLWISQGAPNSVLCCSLQRHCQLPALGLKAKLNEKKRQQSNSPKPPLVNLLKMRLSLWQAAPLHKVWRVPPVAWSSSMDSCRCGWRSCSLDPADEAQHRPRPSGEGTDLYLSPIPNGYLIFG